MRWFKNVGHSESSESEKHSSTNFSLAQEVRKYMKSILPIVLLLIVGAAYSWQQSDYSARLDSVLESVKSYLAERKPEWTLRAIEPIKGSRNVSVNNWESKEQIVRISFMALGSREKAAEHMRLALAHTKPEQRLPELGDGGYSLGGTGLCFWKQDLCVCVSTTMTTLERDTATTMEFAKLVDAALPGS